MYSVFESGAIPRPVAVAKARLNSKPLCGPLDAQARLGYSYRKATIGSTLVARLAGT